MQLPLLKYFELKWSTIACFNRRNGFPSSESSFLPSICRIAGEIFQFSSGARVKPRKFHCYKPIIITEEILPKWNKKFTARQKANNKMKVKNEKNKFLKIREKYNW